MKNMILGGVFGGIIGAAGIIVGLFSLGGYISGEMIQSYGDSTTLKYNNYRYIEDSYRLLGVRNKIKYIRDNNIVELSGMNEISLLLEWEAHNIAYYLDIFGMLRKHSKDVDFG